MYLSREFRAVTQARILDPEGGTLSDPRDIILHEGRIAAITAPGEVDARDDEVLDAGGRVVMPGLIDAHVHVTASTADLARLGETSPFLVAAQAQQLMGQMLLRGFTSVRDAAGADYGLAEAVDRDLFVAPRLFFGGKALSQTGGHGDVRGPGSQIVDDHACCPHIGIVCDGVSEVRRAARAQLRTGAHHVKVMLSGGVASPTDRVDSTQFSDEEILAIVEEATGANRYVLGHAYTARAVNRGLRLGVRSIEHGNLIDETSIPLFREYDAFLVPTLVTYDRLKAEGAEHGLPPASQRKVDDVLSYGLGALKLATEGGANVVFGTDLLGGMQQHQSREFLIRAEVASPQQILRSATTTAARLLQAEGELGVVAPGAHADLLVVEGNPLEDITLLADPATTLAAVLKGGRQVVDPAA
ncbi:metal-dependent hydrolase family protein [Aeromicrobium camelliae]|uniref:metal-dependent hydrolase family protein n=1 Tax=Aeromicrobium camelliae TaxID=1538144 RepID=UPI00140D7A36|nr:amidohydrolase family protein [Aeromicrobium camelliae]